MDKKIIFLNSILPRSGHNFASEVIKIYTDHQVLAHGRSETKLAMILASFYRIKNNLFYESDKKFLDSLFVSGLRGRLTEQSNKNFIMIKDTSIVGVKSLKHTFPEDLHILFLRDPKAIFLSLIKGMNLQKGSLKNRLKKIGILTGLYPFTYSRKLSNQILKNWPDTNNTFILKYEDLVNKQEVTLEELKILFNSSKDLSIIKEEIDAIPVINSSFYHEVNAANIWDSRIKTADFKPLERGGSSFLVRKGVELGSKNLRKKLGYL